MIGKDINVIDFTKEQAIDFIKYSCKNCEIRKTCNKMDGRKCEKKIDYLIDKFKSK